jgi:hypothetical protein
MQHVLLRKFLGFMHFNTAEESERPTHVLVFLLMQLQLLFTLPSFLQLLYLILEQIRFEFLFNF